MLGPSALPAPGSPVPGEASSGRGDVPPENARSPRPVPLRARRSRVAAGVAGSPPEGDPAGRLPPGSGMFSQYSSPAAVPGGATQVTADACGAHARATAATATAAPIALLECSRLVIACR